MVVGNEFTQFRHGFVDYNYFSLNHQVINPRRVCAARFTVLGLFVCVFVCVTQHLTFHVIIRATNDTDQEQSGPSAK